MREEGPYVGEAVQVWRISRLYALWRVRRNDPLYGVYEIGGITMPAAINTLHLVLTVISFGILFGLGFALIHKAVAWPANQVALGAALICLLLVALAWVVR